MQEVEDVLESRSVSFPSLVPRSEPAMTLEIIGPLSNQLQTILLSLEADGAYNRVPELSSSSTALRMEHRN